MENNKDKTIDVSIILEEYIPLKILIDREDEPIKNISYFNGRTSLLEFSVGITSGLIKRITLLLSKEYDVNCGKLNIVTYESGDLRVNDKPKNSCSYFKTHLFEDGIKIRISEEKIYKYVKMDKLYIGLSNLSSIVEVCLCQLTLKEIEHIKDELDYQ